jgi:hypothetical protein
MSIERLELRHGEKVTAEHLNALDRAIARSRYLPGPRVRRRVWPWGTSHSYYGHGGTGSAPVFQPVVNVLDRDTAEVRWDGPRATIGGVAPTIDDVEIFEKDEATGQRPALLVQRSDFGDQAECGIYFRVTVGTDFRAKSVTPIAAPSLPDRAAYQADCLALFLRLRAGSITYNEEDDRELFSSQGFFAVLRRPSGIFEPLFWAKF